MKILAACKLCSDVLVPVRSQPKIFAGAAQMRFCRTASSCETQGLTAVPPPRATSSADDGAKTAAALIYTSKSLNRCGILAHTILNFYDFSFHIQAKSNGVQLRVIRLLAKFSLRISDYAYEIYAKMEF